MSGCTEIDGRAFHTFCRSFDKPFDDILVKTMQDTMKYLCENIEGCALGYAQSDEISLLLIDYKKLDTAACLIMKYRNFVLYQQVWQL